MHRKFGLLSPGAAIVQHYPVFCCLFFPCVQCFRVSIIHQTHIDYSIFNVRTWSFLYVHYTLGLGTPIASQHNILTRKNSHKLFLCSRRGSNFWPLDLESVLYPLSHPVTPMAQTALRKKEKAKLKKRQGARVWGLAEGGPWWGPVFWSWKDFFILSQRNAPFIPAIFETLKTVWKKKHEHILYP